MEDKLYINLNHSKCKPQQGVVKITPEAMEKLLKLQSRSGMPLRQLASEMIKYASDRVEFIYED